MTNRPGITATSAPRLNRLARERSPYLLQHRANPVDWFAWGAEAFEKARREDRPIFLSIGYSTCHWCHVMERESFENQAIAEFLNAHFVSIKVDREERPDVDRIYMTFVQATTGHGGWPLNVFLLPDLKPFFGGTYFPPAGALGRPGLLDLLRQIRQLWAERRDDIVDSAAEAHSRIQQATAAAVEDSPADVALSPAILRAAGDSLKASYDPQHGGFGGAPKFPQPSQPQFLLRYAKRFNDDEAIRMVLHTCDRMAAGGIHDQLGGGFARYAVDAEWLVPHFEKMLYDNAQLAQLFLDAWLVSGEPRFADTVRDILQYVLRDMTHPQGGFFSAEDADSEGHEGKFYCWTRERLSNLLTRDEFGVAALYFGVTEEGNFVDHSHPRPLPKQNVLSVANPALSGADRLLLNSARQKMIALRAKRVRPHLDDKVLTSWNGLMLGALARAYAALDEETYLVAARKNLAFIQKQLWDSSTRTIYHRWRDGERDAVQLLDSYAFLLSGVLDLYEATLNPDDLEFALAVGDSMVARFYDARAGGFWQSAPGASDLILNVKQDYDGAEPSGNSVAIHALLKLAPITNRQDLAQAAQQSLALFAPRLRQIPQALPHMLQALDFALEQPRRVVVAGDPSGPKVRRLLRALHAVYQPNKVLLGTSGPVDSFAKTLPATDDGVVYLCTGTACQPPVSDPHELQELLT